MEDHLDLSGNDGAERDGPHQALSRHVQELKRMTLPVLVCWERDISSMVAPSGQPGSAHPDHPPVKKVGSGS